MRAPTPEPRQPAMLEVAEMMGRHGPRTPLTHALLAANLIVFAALLTQGAGLWHAPIAVQLSWGAGFGPATKDGQWWRLVSAMFLHFGVLHLGVNLWALHDAGRLLERLIGSWRFGAVYLLGGLCGNLLSLVMHGDHAVSGGASGAIFALFGALLVVLWLERRRIHAIDFRWLFGGAAAFAAATIAFGTLVKGIDNAAHLGGLTTGALLGAALARQTPLHPRRFATGAFVAVVAALVVLIPAPSYRWRDELRARSEIRSFLRDEPRIVAQWQDIVDRGRAGGASFDQLADRIDETVAREYRDSFEQLSSIELDPAAPSAPALDVLKRYTQLRSEASRALADALRARDPERISESLEQLRQAPRKARRAEDVGPSTAPLPQNAH
jgi:rhomboid protease GluP